MFNISICEECGNLCNFFSEKAYQLYNCETYYNFCCLKCLKKYIDEEYRKENPRKNIITGGK